MTPDPEKPFQGKVWYGPSCPETRSPAFGTYTEAIVWINRQPKQGTGRHRGRRRSQVLKNGFFYNNIEP